MAKEIDFSLGKLTVGVSGLFYITVDKKGLDFAGDCIILLLLHLYSGALDTGRLKLNMLLFSLLPFR